MWGEKPGQNSLLGLLRGLPQPPVTGDSFLKPALGGQQMTSLQTRVLFFVLFCFVLFCFFETGFLCVALAVLELTL